MRSEGGIDGRGREGGMGGMMNEVLDRGRGMNGDEDAIEEEIRALRSIGGCSGLLDNHLSTWIEGELSGYQGMRSRDDSRVTERVRAGWASPQDRIQGTRRRYTVPFSIQGVFYQRSLLLLGEGTLYGGRLSVVGG